MCSRPSSLTGRGGRLGESIAKVIGWALDDAESEGWALCVVKGRVSLGVCGLCLCGRALSLPNGGF